MAYLERIHERPNRLLSLLLQFLLELIHPQRELIQPGLPQLQQQVLLDLHELHGVRLGHHDPLVGFNVLLDELGVTDVLGDAVHEREEGFITIPIIRIHYLWYLDPSIIKQIE